MKIVCISDTHNLHDGIDLPEGDILVHAGDATMSGTFLEVNRFGLWFKNLPYEHKIFVAGNHDFLFEDDPYVAKTLVSLQDRLNYYECYYLHDQEIVIEGIKFYGSPYQPWFHDWAFNLDRNDGSLARKWAQIPDDTNVLIVHGPPHGILDKTVEGTNVGCHDLAHRIMQLPDLRLGVFGHIHESYGIHETPDYVLVNASICNRKYKAVNAPIVVEI